MQAPGRKHCGRQRKDCGNRGWQTDHSRYRECHCTGESREQACNGCSPDGIGEAAVVRGGEAATIFTYGAMVSRSLDAADTLEQEGVDARVVDLRTLSPLDTETIARCVRETGRAVVVHEAPRTLGLGAEITARIVEEAFDFLEAPVWRVTGYDVPYPPAALEQHYLPSVERIAGAVREVVAY